MNFFPQENTENNYFMVYVEFKAGSQHSKFSVKWQTMYM